MLYQQIIDFWFKELSPQQWWVKSTELDDLIRQRFGDLHQQASQCELFEWRISAEGALAEIIILDQFSRNIYRDTPQAFSSDSMALTLAQQAVEKGFDQLLVEQQRGFMYLPYMHSESSIIHQEAVKLYSALGNQQNLDFELKHQVIIERFGRYPHRNELLNRSSTVEEIAFLQEPNSSF